MTEIPTASQPRIPAALASRTTSGATKKPGPAPSRILAAAASVSAGIGLVALMAGGQQEIVVEVPQTNVIVEVLPAPVVTTAGPASNPSDALPAAPQIEVRVVEVAEPAPPTATKARAVTQSEGS